MPGSEENVFCFFLKLYLSSLYHLIYPVQLSGYSAKNVRRIQKTLGCHVWFDIWIFLHIPEVIYFSIAIGHDADLLISSILTESYQGTPAVSLTDTFFWIDGTDHIVCDHCVVDRYPLELLTFTI